MSDSPDDRSIVLAIESVAAGGDGVARDSGGRVVFVPRAAPGDRVRATVTEEHKSFARAHLDAVLEPGPGRVAPPCPLFASGACGGCQWQHLSSEAQRAAKEAIVGAALRRLVDAGLAIEPLRTPVPPLGWRRRARLHWVRPRRAGAALIGFFAPGSRHVTDVDRCPQLEPAADAALAAIRRVLGPVLTGRGEIDVVAGQGGGVHVTVRGPCAPAAARALAEAPEIAGVRLGRRQFGAEAIALEPGLEAASGEFAQASSAGNAALLEVVNLATRAREGKRVLELYAGGGNLTRVLARGAAEVIAVERAVPVAPPAGGNVSFRQGSAEEEVKILARHGERFDLVVLDPPRTGAADACQLLPRLGPSRIVYVSCDPATLARDAGALVAAGYAPVRAWPIDMMPQTAHVEVVLELVGSDPPSGL